MTLNYIKKISYISVDKENTPITMLQVQDLRIGNLVEFDDLYYSVHEITQQCNDCPYDLTLRDDHTLMFQDAEIEECSPIPLTEEWLIKFGLERNEGTFVKSLYYYALPLKFRVFKNGKISLYIRGELNERTQCKYVHQLQNLYYALTGKELNIEESLSPTGNELSNQQNK